MGKWKRFMRKLLYPPIPGIAVMCAVTAACLFLIFWLGYKDTIPAYVFYAFSAYTLVTVILRIREYLLAWKKKLQKYYYFNKYVTDMEVKAEVSLYTALAVNVLYSLYEAFPVSFTIPPGL